MNRAQRRGVKREAHRHLGNLAHPIPGSVALTGGPMHGWVVKPDAPALRPGWHATWPPTVTAEPGRYVLDEAGRSASWHVNG